ncbi:hypothetical protein [Streptomyces sp. NPDC002205]|uniref:hypothetical protein n=1 Tax=Streptomyces sp. NPDC002205 TaxID=3154411 RepID=UPI00331AB059
MTVIAEVRGAGGWCGAEVAISDEWRVELSAVHQAELRAAVGAVESAGLGLADFSREDFPLPTLGPLLHSLVCELMDGRGFVLLQGAPVADLSEQQCEILALGAGRHVGRTVNLRAGDMQFLNNHATLHSRIEYVDHPEPERRRDLVRLWLSTDRDRHAPS